jgi:serine/threonine protein kinase
LQFEAEMRTLCSLSSVHPNICSLFAFCTDGPQRCLVLELCTGGSLDKRLACEPGAAQPPLSWQARVRIAAGVLYAVFHSMPLVSRRVPLAARRSPLSTEQHSFPPAC